MAGLGLRARGPGHARRFASEGNDAMVFLNDGWGEHQDGHDTLQWIAGQTWCNGKIGTWGGSALGITQNMLGPGRAGAPSRPARHRSPFRTATARPLIRAARFARELMREAGCRTTASTANNCQTFLAHPTYDDFWAELNSEAAGRQGQRAGGLHRRLVRHLPAGHDQSFVAIQDTAAPAPGQVPAGDRPVGHGEASSGARIPGQRRQAARKAPTPFASSTTISRARTTACPRTRPCTTT